ncbi:IclR family transcriptional regulator [Vibrio sp. MEBiC08052]|uniref:IclR family transcriptional regulator n=1 Tax=Vibrio sp. MEBiC08052 TaxID=1761910 RepID=UPI0007406FFE|nr:IclR family transcriptional regulator [Vibrio sp. MEBiC08052]KUI99581.1 IclR family transcriptional regulator [Vibrio sp. MEBiC08052]
MRARGIERAFQILEFLRNHEKAVRPIEIAKALQAPTSSIYELIKIMLDMGVLENFHKDGRVFLGRQLHFLGASYLKNFSLASEAETYLEHLSTMTRETAQLCMLDGHKYTVAMMKEGDRPFRISANIGEKVAIPWTASGRLLLNHLSNEDILAFIDPDDFILPDGKRLPETQFLQECNQAKEDGFFSFNSISDTFTRCFAAPVFDENQVPVATLCLIAPKEDALQNFDDYKSELVSCAYKLTQKLNGSN